MSKEAVERFLGRLLTDDDFRAFASESLFMACMQEDFAFREVRPRALRLRVSGSLSACQTK